jgi:hypothetical protein
MEVVKLYRNNSVFLRYHVNGATLHGRYSAYTRDGRLECEFNLEEGQFHGHQVVNATLQDRANQVEAHFERDVLTSYRETEDGELIHSFVIENGAPVNWDKEEGFTNDNDFERLAQDWKMDYLSQHEKIVILELHALTDPEHAVAVEDTEDFGSFYTGQVDFRDRAVFEQILGDFNVDKEIRARPIPMEMDGEEAEVRINFIPMEGEGV